MRWGAALVVMGLIACDSDSDGGTTTGVRLAPAGKPWATLAEWQLFADARLQVPAEGCLLYTSDAADE